MPGLMEALNLREDESHGSIEGVARRASRAGGPHGGRPAWDPATRKGALARVGEQLGISPETLRNCATQARSTPVTAPAPRPATASGWPSWRRRTVSFDGRTRSYAARRHSSRQYQTEFWSGGVGSFLRCP